MTEWTTVARWLAHTAVGGGLLLLLVCGGVALLRQPVRRQRLGEWGTVAALLLAVLSLGPAWLYVSLPFPARDAAVSAAEQPAPLTAAASIAPADATDNPPSLPGAIIYYYPVDDVRPPEPATEPARPVNAIATPATSLDPHDTIRLVLALYVAGALFLIGRWLIGYLWLWRLVRSGRPAPEAVARLFAEMAVGLRPLPRLLVARRLRVPISCGLLRPTVVVPAAWCRSPAELRWVFAHELTHLQRRDAWSCLLFGLAQPVFFYLPWFWWLRRQVRLCQEYVADAAAAEQPSPVEDYAQFLLGLTMAPAVPVGATGVLGSSSDLFRRVTMLLKSPISVEKGCPRPWSLAVAGGLLAVAVFASGVGLRAEPNDPVPATRRAAAADDQPAPARPAPKDENPRPGEPGVQFDRLRILIQEVERAAPAGNEQAQKEIKKAVEEMHKALQQLQNLQPGANPEPIQKEVQKAMAELQKAMAQQADARRQAAEALKAIGKDRLFFYKSAGDSRLGAHVEPPSPTLVDQLGLNKGEGQVIVQVRPESAAAKAGFHPNDILLQLDGKPVPSDPFEFGKLIDGIKAKEAVDALVLRKGKKETVKGLILPAKPEAARFEFRVPVGAMMPPLPGVPMVPGMLPFPGGAAMIQLLGNPQNAVITTTVRTSDGFTTRYQEGSLIITLTGSTKDGKAKVNEINVQDGAVTNKYESLDKVPKQYQDKVKNLVEMSEKSGTQIEIEKKP